MCHGDVSRLRAHGSAPEGPTRSGNATRVTLFHRSSCCILKVSIIFEVVPLASCRSSTLSAPEPQRQRLRFKALEHDEYPDGRCRIRVSMEWKDGETFVGEASGTQTTEGWLRTSAQAALRAVEASAKGRLTLRLAGIKAVRAFDGWVIIAAVRARSAERSWSLLGAQASRDDEFRGNAVRSVLDAINRVLELHVGDH
jgi:hypothetical protein